MDKLSKQLADLYFTITTVPADGLGINVQTLDSIERVAIQIQNEVLALRRARNREIGESSGMWRAMPPIQRQ
jgi:hypothetical protein